MERCSDYGYWFTDNLDSYAVTHRDEIRVFLIKFNIMKKFCIS